MATYTVKKGDCLWNIAKKQLGSGSKWTQITRKSSPHLSGQGKDIKLKAPWYIYAGDVLDLNGNPPSADANKVDNSNKPKIEYFGTSGNDNELLITWKWDKENTKHFRVTWYYYLNGVKYVGQNNTTTEPQDQEDPNDFKYSTYTIPDKATKVEVKVLPISKEKNGSNSTKKKTYWTAEWSDIKSFDTSGLPPEKPDAPSVALDEVDNLKLKVELDNIDTESLNCDIIDFQVLVLRDGKLSEGAHCESSITIGRAAAEFKLQPGGEYKVRARSKKSSTKTYSEYSDYSESIVTIPTSPGSITSLSARKKNESYYVSLEWPAVSVATSYKIQYATDIGDFDISSKPMEEQTTSATTKWEIEITPGHTYYFRVCAVNANGDSAWSEIKSTPVGSVAEAPTTWSSTTTAVAGEIVNLYWIHNCEDGSSQTYADLELTLDGEAESILIQNTTDEKEKDKTSVYAIDTSLDKYKRVSKIEWRVRTKGVSDTLGEWSVQREIEIFEQPTLSLTVTDPYTESGSTMDTLRSYPLSVYAIAGPAAQTPVSYHLSVVANEDYETVDNVGNVKMVKTGEEVFSRIYDISLPLDVKLGASDMTLANSTDYTISCTVAMNSGLTATATKSFGTMFTDVPYVPNAEISLDEERVATYIRPYATMRDGERCYGTYLVERRSSKTYVATNTEFDPIECKVDETDVRTITGEQVYKYTDSAGNSGYYCNKTWIEYGEERLVEGVTLSVYRREYDGTFTEIATGLANEEGTYIVDPHPSLDYARYRIVSTSVASGAMGYYDVPGYPIGEKSIIIQWDEAWSAFDAEGTDTLDQQPLVGSMIKLLYNIDISDERSAQSTLVEYAGRNYPVSYYGTHRGESATWNAEILKTDKDTLYALRRLSIWNGDVYVREPSGLGYWANIKVTYPQKHCELTIPVSMSIKRVEGGI